MQENNNRGRKRFGSLKVVVFMLVVLILLMVQSTQVLAIGIRPAKTTIISDQISSMSGTVWVVNNDGMDFQATVNVEGEMGQYVTLDNSELDFRSDTDALPVGFSINLPSSVPPGVSTANIVVEQNVAYTGANTISSKVILKHKIIVQGPYPDKYLVAKINFHDTGENIEFVSEVENLGKEEIEEVTTKFYVNDKKRTAHTLETDSTGLVRGENKVMRKTLEKDLFQLGEFEVSAVTEYDGNIIEVVKKLIVGEPRVEVAYFDKYFIANKVNKYTLDLLNNWNMGIKNVFVDVQVRKNNEKIDEFRTRSVDLEAEMTKRLNDYYDARDKGLGSYTFGLMVNFWNLVGMEQDQFNFETEFLSEEGYEDLQVIAPEIQLPSQPKSGKVWLWLVLGLLIGSSGMYVLYRYVHRDQYGGEGAF